MSVAVLFPGQGSAFAQGALEMLTGSPAAQALLDRASAGAGIDLIRHLTRDGGADADTQIQQPLIIAVCLGIYQRLKEVGFRPDLVAGHSLGELAAWSIAGGISAEQAVDLAVLRGRLMGREAERHPGAMAVVKDGPALADILALGARHGQIQVAAHNAPDEWVITGDRDALDAIARRHAIVHLPVSGAWHSSKMAGAVDEFRQALKNVTKRPLTSRLVCNQTGLPVTDERTIPKLLATQLVQPIRWMHSMHTLADAGATTFVTIGPGKTLRAFIRKTLGARVRVLSTETLPSLTRTIEALVL